MKGILGEGYRRDYRRAGCPGGHHTVHVPAVYPSYPKIRDLHPAPQPFENRRSVTGLARVGFRGEDRSDEQKVGTGRCRRRRALDDVNHPSELAPPTGHLSRVHLAEALLAEMDPVRSGHERHVYPVVDE